MKTSLKAHFATIWEEVKDIFKNMFSNFKRAWKMWRNGSTTEQVVDLAFAGLIAWFFPNIAVGIAAANFVDESNTVWLVITGVLSFALLELIAVSFMEIIVILAMIQLAYRSREYVRKYNARINGLKAEMRTASAT